MMTLRKRFPKTYTLTATVALLSGALFHTNSWAANEDTAYLDVSPGKVCWVEAYTNSAAVWTMTLIDGDNAVARFEGKGINFAPMKLVKGNARIKVNEGLIAKFTSATGKAWVKRKTATILNSKNDPAVFFNSMGGEDGGDDDWQDIIANVTCLHHSG